MGRQSKTNLSPREQAQLRASKSTNSTSLGKKLLVVGIILAIIAAVVGIAVAMNKRSAPASYSEINQPPVVKDKGIIVGKDRKIVESPEPGKAEIVIFQDYICPGCGSFEETYGPELDKILDDNVATIEYRSVGMLDSASAGTNYSSRAANAAMCSAVADPDNFYNVNKNLFQKQPEEGTEGLKNAELMKLVKDAGSESDISTCVADGTYRGFVKQLTDYALNDAKISGTPTVLLNGTKVELGGSLYDMVIEANKTTAKK